MKKEKTGKKSAAKETSEKAKEIKENDGNTKPKSGSSITILIVAVVLVISLALLYSFLIHRQQAQKYQSYIYNGFTFIKNGPLWFTQVTSSNVLYTVPLRYGPRELEDVMIYGKLSPNFVNADYVYITFDPEEETNQSYLGLAAAELSLNLAQGINRQGIAACTRNVSGACESRPIVRCENSIMVCRGSEQGNITCKLTEPVIYLDYRATGSSRAEIELSANCIHLKGNGMEIVRAVDRLLLWWYGIMKP